MRVIRIVYRLILMFALTVVFFTLILTGRLVGFVLRRSAARWRNFFIRRWARVMVRATGGRLRVAGTSPEPPFVLVSNHTTYMDAAVLFAVADGVFVAKKEVRSWPVLGWMVAGIDTIFVDRTRRSDVVRVNEAIAAKLGNRQGLMLFPEGTTTNGSEVLRFKPSLLAFPADQGLPVYYATIHYRTAPGDIPVHRAVCWGPHGGSFFVHLLRFLSLRGYEADLQFGEEPVVSDDRKALAQMLWERVTATFVPMVEGDSEEKAPAES